MTMEDKPTILRKLEAIIKEIKEESGDATRPAPSLRPLLHHGEVGTMKRKLALAETERKAYMEISHFFRLVTLSIDDIGTALEVWVKGVLPHLLQKHSIEEEEWERICTVGDSTVPESELNHEWTQFLETVFEKGKISEDLMKQIEEGRKQAGN